MTKISGLVDDFTGTSLDTATWSTVSGTPTVSGGALRLPLRDSAGSEVASVAAWDATDSAVVVKVALSATVTSVDYPQAFIYLTPSGGGLGELTWAISEDDFSQTLSWLAYRPADSLNTGGSVTYDPVAHAWLRTALAGGTITFSASPDGSTWSTIGTATTSVPASWSSVNLNLSGRWNSFGSTPDAAAAAVVDSVNVLPAPTGPVLSSGGQMVAVPAAVLGGPAAPAWSGWAARPVALIAPPPTDYPAPAAPALPTTWAPFPPPGGG